MGRKRFFLFISFISCFFFLFDFFLQIVSEFFHRFLACNWFSPCCLALSALPLFWDFSVVVFVAVAVVVVAHCSNVFCIFYGTCNANTTTTTSATTITNWSEEKVLFHSPLAVTFSYCS